MGLGGGVADAHHLDFKREGLPGERVVHVEGQVGIVHFHQPGWNLPAFGF
jgi:hypothetical protein